MHLSSFILEIDFDRNAYIEFNVEIYNLQGKKELPTQLINVDKRQIHVGKLAKGVYILRVQDVNTKSILSTQKVVVE